MPDILLIQPPIRDFFFTAKRSIPYGLASIATVLRSRGFTVEILDGLATSKSRSADLPAEMSYLREYWQPDVSPFRLFCRYRHYGLSYRQIGESVKASGAFLVGISALFTPYIEEALQTANTVKSYLPECNVVVGGHHATVLPESVMACSAVDFALRGEGEASMPELAGALRSGSAIDSIPGIVFRRSNGTLQINESAVVDRADSYPQPSIDLIKHEFYKRGKKGSAVIAASRGCPMRCSYCSVGELSGIPYRRRSVEHVIQELETSVVRYNAGFIDFEDENLSLDRKWFLKLLREIKTRFKPYDIEIRAMNGLYPPTLDEEIIYEMKQAGFKTLNLSLGSTSAEQLKRFNRRDVQAEFDESLRIAESIGLDAVGYIIAGAPFQRPEAAVDDLLFLAQRRVLAGVSIFYPSPGSLDYHRCEKLNILPRSFSLMRSSALPVSHSTTRADSATILRLGRILNYLKAMLDNSGAIPDARPFEKTKITDLKDRDTVGKQLIRWFLHDGVIRGVHPDGHVYAHAVSMALTRRFVTGLTRIRIRGVRENMEPEPTVSKGHERRIPCPTVKFVS